jgi:hypothetical protein
MGEKKSHELFLFMKKKRLINMCSLTPFESEGSAAAPFDKNG